MRKITIHRAGDTFFYLPLYIAYELGIFKRFLPDIQVEFAPIVTVFDGDLTAIRKIFEENRRDEISIAIADPTSFLLEKEVSVAGQDKKNDIRVIGGLINKPPFWAIDHHRQPLNSKEELEQAFQGKTLIMPERKYATGHALGQELSAKIHTSSHDQDLKIKPCEFGNEFFVLHEHTESEKGNPGDYLVVSGDILAIVKALRKDPNLRPQFCFADEKDDDGNHKECAITSVIANREDVEMPENKSLFVGFLNAIHAAIRILQLSTSCELINILFNEDTTKEKVYNKQLSNEEKEKVFELIQSGDFYSSDLKISLKAWNNALVNLQTIGGARYKVMQSSLGASYSTFTDFRFLDGMEEGEINLLTEENTKLRERNNVLIAENTELANRVQKLETDNKHLKNKWASFEKRLQAIGKFLTSPIIVLMVVTLAIMFFFYLGNSHYVWVDQGVLIGVEFAIFFGVPSLFGGLKGHFKKKKQ